MSQRINVLFFGEVEDGRVAFKDPVQIKRWKMRLHQLEGKPVQVSIVKKKSKRSLNQNSFYWGAILPLISDQVGMIDEEVHEALRLKFLIDNSTPLPRVKSTTELTKGEFVEYLMKIEIWSRDFLGITNWPNPDEWDPAKMI